MASRGTLKRACKGSIRIAWWLSLELLRTVKARKNISWNILRLFLKRAVIVSDSFSFVAHTNFSFLSTQSGGDVSFVCLFMSLGP